MKQPSALNPDEFYNLLPEDRQEPMKKLRKIIQKNIPREFKEVLSYGFPGWAVPHSIYPAGYHCKPEEPLPFFGLGSQKHFIALYHMGLYADPKLLAWFKKEFPKHSKKRLDMGKSCIRFKKPEDIPYELIGELATKMSAEEWIEIYEKNVKKGK